MEITDIASGGKTREQASLNPDQHIWRFLIFGKPGVGKTHFSLTAPEPIIFIDTEGKGDAILEKFDKEIIYFQVSDFDELQSATAQALDTLEAVKKGKIDDFEEGTIGTIVIDRMSDVWEMAQFKYSEKAYPGKDPGEIDFSSRLEGGDDWQMIKHYHNDEFRQPLLRSGFHVMMTAGEQDDFNTMMNLGLDFTPQKASGEKHNEEKCTEYVHLVQDIDGTPVANLRKTALTKWKFGRMRWPTFEKAREAITTISNAERSPDSVDLSKLERELEIDIMDRNPDIVYQQNEDQ